MRPRFICQVCASFYSTLVTSNGGTGYTAEWLGLTRTAIEKRRRGECEINREAWIAIRTSPGCNEAAAVWARRCENCDALRAAPIVGTK